MKDNIKITTLRKLELDIEYRYKKQKRRIFEILESGDLLVHDINLQKYYSYLKENIEKGCNLTEMEDFTCKEPYLLAG